MSVPKSFSVRIDALRLTNLLSSHMMRGLDKAAERLINIVEKEINISESGRPAWRRAMIAAVGVLYKEVGADSWKYVVGVDLAKLNLHPIAAAIVTYGSGSQAKGGGDMIHAGPPGRPVWTKELGRKPSSRPEYPLPQLETPGYDWVQAATDIFEREFWEILKETWSEVDGREVMACFSIRPRR